jgi:hypothetical protein
VLILAVLNAGLAANGAQCFVTEFVTDALMLVIIAEIVNLAFQHRPPSNVKR